MNALFVGCLAALSLAATPQPPPPTAIDLASMVKEHTLSNGMRWLIVERPQAPVFTGVIRIRVGSVDELPGATGLAHLFEHMAFKGTPVFGTKDFEAEKKLLAQIAEVGDRFSRLQRSGKGETDEAKQLKERLRVLEQEAGKLTDENAFSTLYTLNGAAGLNASTNKDVTSYYVSLPKNRLELWALVEASRFASPVLRDFYTERDVVLEERRMRIDSNPSGAAYEELVQLAFTMSPYRWPTVGYSEDLASMTVADADAFFRKHYVPANAVGVLVGDLKTAEVIALLERTFGAIPGKPAPPQPPFAEPPQRAARRSVVSFDANPQLYVAFRKPNAPAADDLVFDVIEGLLASGRTSRLHQRLVLKDRIAQSVDVFGAPGERLDNLAVVGVFPLAGTSIATVEKALWDELERLKREPVSERELTKVKNRVSADHARSLDSNMGLAMSLSYAELILGGWRHTAEHPARVNAVTPAEVQRVANTYFAPERSVVVELRKPTSAAAKGGAR